MVEMGGLAVVFDCRKSAHHIVRKRSLQVIEALVLPSRPASSTSDHKDGIDRYSDEMLRGICGYLCIQPRDVAESAGCLLMRLSRMAAGTGDMWEALRRDPSEPFRIDSRHPDHRYYNGLRLLFLILKDSTVASGVLSNVPAVSAAAAQELASSRFFGNESSASADMWRRSTSAGNFQPKPPRSVSASYSGNIVGNISSLGSMGSTSGGRTVLYKSLKYDSHDYSTVGSVGFSALEALWAPLASAEHSKSAVDGLLREGFLETLASIFEHRQGLMVAEEDRLLLKTLTRTIVGSSSSAEGLLPPDIFGQALSLLQDQSRVEPFCWLDAAQMIELTRSCKYLRLEPATVLTKQGETANSGFLVISGALEMQHHVDTSNTTSELGRLEKGHLFGMCALMLGQTRSATLTVADESPAEVLEISFESLSLLIHDSRLSSRTFIAQYIPYVKANQKADLRVGYNDDDCPLLADARQILCSQSRRGVMSASNCLPRLLQVLLASMPNLGKFQEPLKIDVDVQTQATLIVVHYVTKFPYAPKVYRSGLVLPMLRLLSSSEPSVARNAATVVEGLVCMYICECIYLWECMWFYLYMSSSSATFRLHACVCCLMPGPLDLYVVYPYLVCISTFNRS